MALDLETRQRLVIPIVALLTVGGWLLAPWVATRFGVVLLCPLKMAWLMRRLPEPVRAVVGAPGFPVLVAGLTVIALQLVGPFARRTRGVASLPSA